MSKTYKILIVDDETLSREGIKIGISNIFATKNVPYQIFEAADTISAGEIIDKENPQIVLLDIEMPNENGIDFLARQKKINFEVIIITAYQEYAVDAFRHHAQDYLLKPFNEGLLKSAIDKILLKERLINKAKKYTFIKEMLQVAKTKKLALPTHEGLHLIKISAIVYLKACGSYTEIFVKDKKMSKYSVSKNIKNYENILNSSIFIRIHDSTIVNIDYIEKYVRGEGGFVVLEDGINLDVSKRKKNKLLDILQNKNVQPSLNKRL